ncbi:MAG: hypothetical protein NVS4B8_02280 [Herpetosiphon sp.]
MDPLNWFIFILIAALIVIIVFLILRYWKHELNMSEEEVAYEKRISRLNQGQANRRRDDEIVRLLRGDERRVIGEDQDR